MGVDRPNEIVYRLQVIGEYAKLEYKFEKFRLNSERLSLSENGKLHKVEPQVFALLELLVSQSGQTVSKQDILDKVWNGRHVSDGAINSRISAARTLIGDNGTDQAKIKTIPNVGLRFLLNVEKIEADAGFKIPSPRRILSGVAAIIPLFAIAGSITAINLPNWDKPQQEPAAITSSQPSLAEQAYARGNSLRLKETPQSLDLAQEQYEIALESNPDFAQAYAGLAEVHKLRYIVEDTDFETAGELVDENIAKAQALSPNDVDVLVATASASLLHGRFEDALLAANAAIDMKPDHAFAHNNRGRALVGMNRMDEAKAAFKQALVFQPLSSKILDNLARAHMVTYDYDAALETARENLKWNPDYVNALDMAAYLTWNQGEYSEAHKVLQQAGKLNEAEDFVIVDKLFLYNDIGMRSDMETVIQSDADRAFMYAIIGDKDAARVLVDAAASENDSGDLYYLIGDFEKAAKFMRQEVFERDILNREGAIPGLIQFYAETCFTYRQIGEVDGDIICKKLSDTFSGQSPEAFPLVLDRLGGMAWHMINRDRDKALEWLDHLIDQGHSFVHLTDQHVFRPLRNYPPYTERLARMETNAEKHRAGIKPQLTQ